MTQTLQSIQRLINRMIGIARYEAALREHARVVFGKRRPDFARFDGPAYLRRSARIGQRHRQYPPCAATDITFCIYL